jgi:hypothetical protein
VPVVHRRSSASPVVHASSPGLSTGRPHPGVQTLSNPVASVRERGRPLTRSHPPCYGQVHRASTSVGNPVDNSLRSPRVTGTTARLSTPPVDSCGRAACRGGRIATPGWSACERHPTVNTAPWLSTASSTSRPQPGSPRRPARTPPRPQDPQLLQLRRDPQNSDSAPSTTRTTRPVPGPGVHRIRYRGDKACTSVMTPPASASPPGCDQTSWTGIQVCTSRRDVLAPDEGGKP